MPKVILDAGHGGSDIGEYYERRSEKNDNLSLAFRVGKFLVERGIDVGYIRISDRYLTMMERLAIADNIGGDLLVSIHRGTFHVRNESPSLDFFIGMNDKLGEAAANKIGRSLYGSGYLEYNVIVDNDLPLVNDTDMPAIMAEIGYILLDKDNIKYDTHFLKIAEDIAEGIYKTLVPTCQQQGGVNESDDVIPLNYQYRISIGPYRDYNMAIEQQYVISRWGYETEIMKSKNGFMIYIGEYGALDQAVSIEKWFRKCGYCTYIIRV